MIEEHKILEQFFASLELCGIEPRSEFTPIMDGRIHYFDVEGHKRGNQAGRYFIHADECPNWGVMDYYKHDGMQKFKYEFSETDRVEYAQGHSQRTPAQLEAQRQANEARKMEELKRQKEQRRQALKIALEEYKNAFAVAEHPYLKSRFEDKGIYIPDCGIFSLEYAKEKYSPEKHGEGYPDEEGYIYDVFTITRYPIKRTMYSGAKFKAGDLIIPLRNALTSKLQSFQRISDTPNKAGKYFKSFCEGLPATDSCHELIPTHAKIERLFICEGFCTGLAVIKLTDGKYPVFCAMSAHNIMNVAQGLRQRYNDTEIVIAADNDAAGLKAADETISAGYAEKKVVPPEKGDDWYDYIAKEVIS